MRDGPDGERGRGIALMHLSFSRERFDKIQKIVRTLTLPKVERN
jgi:hypothetical protein